MQVITLSVKKIQKSLTLVAILIFTFLSLNYMISSHLLLGYSLYDMKRLLELLLLAFTSTFIICSSKQRKAWLTQFLQLPLVVRCSLLSIVAVGVLSSIFAPRTSMALVETALFTLLFCFALAISTARTALGVTFEKSLLISLLLLVAMYEVNFIYVTYIENVFITPTSYPIFYDPGFSNPRFFSLFQVLTLPLLPLVCTLFRQRFIRYATYGVLTIWWVLAFANGAKGLFIALAVAITLCVMLFRKAIFPWLRIQISTVCIGFGLFQLNSVVFSYIQHHLTHIYNQANKLPYPIHSNINPIHASIANRLTLWKESFSLIRKHLLLGVGPMHFAYYSHNKISAHPHNSLILFATEWGIPVAVMVLGLIGWGYYALIKRYHYKRINTWVPYSRETVITLFIAVTAAWLYSLIAGILIFPLSQVMLAIACGWLLAIYYQDKIPYHKTTISKWQHLCLIVILIAPILTLIITIGPTLPSLSTNEILWYFSAQKSAVHNFNPRFWLQGLL